MAEKMNIDPSASQLSPEAIAFATKMYDAARAGQMDIFEQALPAGLPANMTNEKGDSLVSLIQPPPKQFHSCCLLLEALQFCFYVSSLLFGYLKKPPS
jgi:hypothetical protein